MDLIKIKLRELKAFCNGNLYSTFPVKPISPLRVESYLKNPRANMDDFVMYMFVDGNELMAFRTVLSDYIIVHGEKISFGWCSGNYVKPECRGQKLSMLLLSEVIKDWETRLMFTNYAQASEYCYLNSGLFNILQQRSGLRFYLYPDFNRIYKHRETYHQMKWILPLLSKIVCTMSHIYFKIHTGNSVRYNEIPSLDEECTHYLNQYPDTFYNRKMPEIDWIMQYPWIMQSEDTFPYPFSYCKKSYKLRVVKIFDKNRFVGFFIYTLIESQMKIIYHFVERTHRNVLADVIIAVSGKNHIEYLTILDSEMAGFFKRRWGFLIVSKRYISNIYTSINIDKKDNMIIFDGDGDNCFT